MNSVTSRIGWTRFFLAGAMSIFLCQTVAVGQTTPGRYTQPNSNYTYSGSTGTVTIVPPVIYPQLGVTGQYMHYRAFLYKYQNGGWTNLGTLSDQTGYGTAAAPFRPTGRQVYVSRYGSGYYMIGMEMQWASRGYWVGTSYFYPKFNMITTSSIGAVYQMGTSTWAQVR